ncbi:hypothetical protein D3C87_1616930 [compost metagenome]
MRKQCFELYDLLKDISEQNNLANERPEEVKTLARTLGEILKKRSALMPIERVNGKMIPFPDELIR